MTTMDNTARINLRINKKKSSAKTSDVSSHIRDKGRTILSDVLSGLDQQSLTDLEMSINDATIKTLEREGLIDINMNDIRAQRTYDQFLRKVCLHLNPNSPVDNTYLLQAVKGGSVKLTNVATMTPIMLHPQSWSKQSADQILEAERVADGVKKAAARILTCNKCLASGNDAKNVIYKEEQNRSADEAMTIHAECRTCGSKWTN